MSTPNEVKKTTECEDCENCATIQKAGLNEFISKFSERLKSSLEKNDALQMLEALKNNLETFSPSANCLIKRVESTISIISEPVQTYVSHGGKLAASVLIAEIKAFAESAES